MINKEDSAVVGNCYGTIIMNMRMKNILIILFLLLSLCTNAQELDGSVEEEGIQDNTNSFTRLIKNIIFTYDACGNRIKRSLRLSANPLTAPQKSPSSKVENQTTSCIVTLEGWNTDCSGYIELYNTAGQWITRKPINGCVTAIDMNTQPGGVYVVKININGKVTTKEFIKN